MKKINELSINKTPVTIDELITFVNYYDNKWNYVDSPGGDEFMIAVYGLNKLKEVKSKIKIIADYANENNLKSLRKNKELISSLFEK